MKRTIACFLACMLLIPGMLVYTSAEETNVGDVPSFTVDWDFQYDDSKAYLPVIRVGIVTSTNLNGQLGPLEDLFTNYSGRPFVDFEEAKYWAYNISFPNYYDEKLPPELQLDDTYICDGICQITFDRPMTRHELISFAHLLVTEPLIWGMFGIDPDKANNYSVYVSLVEKEVETQNWDDFEEFRTDSQLYFHEDTLRVGVDLTYVPRYYSWSKEDFPELEGLKDVDVYIYKENNPYIPDPYVELTLTFNTPGRETLEDAMQKLGKRYEFDFVHFDYGVVFTDMPGPPFDDITDETTIPDETTVPVADIETTEPATDETIGGTETTGEPDEEKPTSPQTGDAGKYAACVCAVALLGVAGVVIYRRRRSA